MIIYMFHIHQIWFSITTYIGKNDNSIMLLIDPFKRRGNLKITRMINIVGYVTSTNKQSDANW